MTHHVSVLADSLTAQALENLFPTPFPQPSKRHFQIDPAMASDSPPSQAFAIGKPSQAEGLPAAQDPPAARPFPIFEELKAPVQRVVTTHSLTLSWTIVRQSAVGGDLPEGVSLPDCRVNYLLEMQLMGTVSILLANSDLETPARSEAESYFSILYRYVR